MEIDINLITEAGETATSEVIGDINTLKSYFEDIQMVDLDGKPPTKVADAIQRVLEKLEKCKQYVDGAKTAAENINNIPID